MTRKIDQLGRVVIPVEMRSKLLLEKEDIVNIDCVNDTIILSKSKPNCIICHSVDCELFPIDQTLICYDCIKKIKSL